MQREKLRPAELPVVPGFELVRRLGRGGMGEVFEAVRLGSGGFRKPVALKTLNPGLEPKSLDRFLHECRLTAQLEHPNIVRVYDLLTIGQRHFLVMELMRGRVLSVLQEPQGGPAWFALSVADQVLDGLAYAHGFTDETGLPLRIIHRDLTPRNVFVCDSGTVKILDFGLAKMKDAAALALTQEGMVAGTPAYLSPEQANGRALDARTDLYQLGATLYELLTGRPPHGGGYLHEQLAHARSGLFTPLAQLRPDLPAGVVAVVEKALAPNPADRFPSARAMRDAVNAELAQFNPRGPEALARVLANRPVPPAVPPPRRTATPAQMVALGSENARPTAPEFLAITGETPAVQPGDSQTDPNLPWGPERATGFVAPAPTGRSEGRAETAPEFLAIPHDAAAQRPANERRPNESTGSEITVPGGTPSVTVPSVPSVTVPGGTAVARAPIPPGRDGRAVTLPELGAVSESPTAPNHLAQAQAQAHPRRSLVDPDSQELPRDALVAGRYRILRFLARGGMGAVYEAEDLELKEKVALKTIRPELAGDERAVERFKREIHLARRVTHPNVCRIFDIGFHSEGSGRVSSPGVDRIVFLTMELVEGETLAQRMRRQERLTTEEALPLVTQLSLGLAAAHRAGVVHGDFKPENVVLEPPRDGEPHGRAVITDFGLARATVATTGSSPAVAPSFAGSPAYMSPEQVEGQPVTSASDIFALGCVLFEMVTGERPYAGDSPVAVTTGRLRGPPPPPSSRVRGLDPIWDATILRCLERSPDKRFHSADEVVLALGGAEVTVSSPRLGLSPLQLSSPNLSALRIAAVQKPRGPSSRLLGVALGLVLVLVGGLIWKIRDMGVNPAPATGPGKKPVKLRRAVAVLGFHNLSGRPDAEWLSTALGETLAAELGAGGDLRTVPGEDVSRAKVELSITNPNTVGEETLKKLGANVRTDLVLSGAYLALGEKGGGKVRVDLQVQDVRRGEVVAKVSDSGTEAELLDLVSRTGARLREQLGLSALSTAQVGEVASTLPGRPEATRLYAEGLARLRGWDYPAARELLEKAAEVDPEHPLVHSALSAVWVAIGDKGKARAAAKQALALAGNLSREERMWVEGLYHEAAESWDAAAQTYQSLWTFAPDNIEYGLHLVTVQLQLQQGPEEAMKTLVALRALPPPASEDPRIDLLEARAAQASSDYKREREAAARCAARAGKLGAKLQVAQCRMLEAWALSLTGDNAGALASYDDARGICEAAGNRSCLAVALEGLGILRSDMGELDDARTKLEEALALKRALGAESSQLSTLNNLALVHQRQGDLAGARKAYEAELEISRRLGLRVWTAYAQVNLGTVFLLVSDLGQSEKSYTEALALFQERHDGRGIAECLAGLSEIHLQRGDLDRAEARVSDGLAALRSQGIKDGMFRLLMDQGKLQRHRGALADSRKTHGDALAVANELGERASVSEARLALGELALDEGRPVEAQALARQAADEFAAQKLPGWETRARSLLALALLADHKLPEARQELTAAGGLVDQGTGREDRAYYRIAMARVDGAAGTLTRATRLLESDLRELTRMEQLPLQYEARLALGELGLASAHVASAKRDLKALAKEAKAHQFHLVARKALAKAEN